MRVNDEFVGDARIELFVAFGRLIERDYLHMDRGALLLNEQRAGAVACLRTF
jgi:hypothetical protein